MSTDDILPDTIIEIDLPEDEEKLFWDDDLVDHIQSSQQGPGQPASTFDTPLNNIGTNSLNTLTQHLSILTIHHPKKQLYQKWHITTIIIILRLYLIILFPWILFTTSSYMQYGR